MRNWNNRLVTEATLQAADELGSVGEALRSTGHESLATIARKPNVIAAVNKAREVFPKEHWQKLNRPSSNISEDERRALLPVWNALPGYTCMMDAIAILARL